MLLLIHQCQHEDKSQARLANNSSRLAPAGHCGLAPLGSKNQPICWNIVGPYLGSSFLTDRLFEFIFLRMTRRSNILANLLEYGRTLYLGSSVFNRLAVSIHISKNYWKIIKSNSQFLEKENINLKVSWLHAWDHICKFICANSYLVRNQLLLYHFVSWPQKDNIFSWS